MLKKMVLHRALTRAYHYEGLFHASLAFLSNHYVGIDVNNEGWQPRPVHKFEGGVLVRNREVIPFLSPLEDRIDAAAVDRPRRSDDTEAVIRAASELLTELDWEGPPESVLKNVAGFVSQRTGTAPEIFEDKARRFAENPFVDPLRLLFDLIC